MNRDIGIMAIILAVAMACISVAGLAGMDDWQEKEYPAGVVTVIDGDTVEVVIFLGGKKFVPDTVRLAGIDAPEKGESGYEEAKAYLKDRVYLKMVTLILKEKADDVSWQRGYYNRVIGRIVIDGADVGAEMMEKGLVEKYKK